MTGSTLLIERSPGEVRAAVIRDGMVLAVEHYRNHMPVLDGAVFHGRIRRVEAGISAAFVDLDGTREGFLRARAIAGRRKGESIASHVHEGKAILVRVVDGANDDDDKLPRIATLSDSEAKVILDGAALSDAPACIYPGPDPVERILAEHGAAADCIVCNGGPDKRVTEQWRDSVRADIDVQQQPGDLFAAHDVDAAVDAALLPGVVLDGGATLLFEPGRTLCAVDVNSAGQTGVAGRTARDVNLAAVPEIARQLRLREIGGAIVIDFLKMSRDDDRTRLVAAMREALSDDPAECHVLGMSRLGLVEMTRQRRKPTLASRLLQARQPAIARPDAVACDVLRDLSARARAGGGGFTVKAAPAIVALLRGSMADSLADAVAVSRGHVIVRDAGEFALTDVEISDRIE